MPITLEKKKELVSGLEQSLKSANSVVFVKFDKLTVSNSNSLRRSLQAEGVGYIVAKKSLLKRALSTFGVTGEAPEMPGQIAVAYSTDLLAGARGIFGFQKGHKDNVAIVGGIFEGRYMSASEMLGIATIPPMQTLRGMFVNVINSPIQGFVSVLDQIAQSKS